MTQPRHLIVAAVPLSGHTRPMLGLTAALVAAGREVTFVGGSRFAEEARATGATFVPLEGDGDFDDRRLADHLPDLATMPPSAGRHLYITSKLLLDPIPSQSATLQKLLATHPEAVVLYDVSFAGLWPQLVGAPGIRPHRVISVGVFPVLLPGAELTLVGPPPPIEGLDTREAAAVVNAQTFKEIVPQVTHLQQVLAAAGAEPPLPDNWFHLVHELPDAFAQLTVPSFEYPRVDAPANLHLVGALLPTAAPDWEPPAWWPELTGRRVVVVTQGTLANADFAELVQPTLDALADSDVLVVAALGREPAPGELRVPDNVRTAAFVPFEVLFPYADAVVTNGGYGTTQLALAHGVPLVVSGLTEEKPYIAGLVAASGAGINLVTRNADSELSDTALGTDNDPAGQWATPEAVGAAVHRVLTESTFRERAKALQAEYAAADPVGSILKLIDEDDPGS